MTSATTEPKCVASNDEKYLTPVACLNGGCNFVCVTEKGFGKQIVKHMKKCSHGRRSGAEITVAERVNSMEKAQQVLLEKLRNNVYPNAANRLLNCAKNLTAVSATCTFACTGQGCLFGCHQWEFVCDHMKDCKLASDKRAKRKKCMARAAELNLPPRVAFVQRESHSPTVSAFPTIDMKLMELNTVNNENAAKKKTKKLGLEKTENTRVKEAAFACLGENCKLTFHNWGLATTHMKKCNCVLDKNLKGKMKKSRELAQEHRERILSPKGEKKKPRGLIAQEYRGRDKNLKGKVKKSRREGVRLGLFVPSIKLLFIYSTFQSPRRDKQEERVKINEAQIHRLVNDQWNLAFYEREYLRKTAGSSRGNRKLLRADKTWQDFAAEPPLILTHHAKERLAERGTGSIPRFVAGTKRTVVATFIPNKNPQGRERWKRYMASLRFRSERFRRKQEAVKARWKRMKRKKIVPKDVKKSHFKQVKYRKSLAMRKSLPFGSLTTPRLISKRTKKGPVSGKLNYSGANASPRSSVKTKFTRRSTNDAKNFACLGKACSFCCEDWNAMVKHLRACQLYGMYSARGKMKKSREKATQMRSTNRATNTTQTRTNCDRTKAHRKNRSARAHKTMATSRCIEFGPPPALIDYSKFVKPIRFAQTPTFGKQQTSPSVPDSTDDHQDVECRSKATAAQVVDDGLGDVDSSNNLGVVVSWNTSELSLLTSLRSTRRTKVTIGDDKKAKLWQAMDAHMTMMMRSNANCSN